MMDDPDLIYESWCPYCSDGVIDRRFERECEDCRQKFNNPEKEGEDISE